MSIPLIDIDRHEKFIGGTFVLQYTISSLLFGFFGNRNVNKRSVEFFLFLLLFIMHFIYCVIISLCPFGQSYITPVYALRVQLHTFAITSSLQVRYKNMQTLVYSFRLSVKLRLPKRQKV